MKKRFVLLSCIGILCIGLWACNSPAEKNEPSKKPDSVSVDNNLLTTEITIPADFVGETTQEDLDQIAKEHNFTSIKLNPDGSATYFMSKVRYKDYLNELAQSINDGLNETLNSGDYPNFKEITANKDFTKFTIKTTSTELDFNESLSSMIFYMYGGLYNSFAGNENPTILVDYINADSGKLIDQFDSSESENTEASDSMTYSDTDGIIDIETEIYKIAFSKYDVGTDEDGNPCLYYYYNFTNNGTENTNAMSESGIKCFQNGIECDYAYADYNKEMENYTKDIQPGTTIEVCECFSLTDLSEVTLEATNLFSFDSGKDIQKITLN